MWKPEDVLGLPVVPNLSVLKSEALAKGRIEFADHEFDIPEFYKSGYVPPLQEAMAFAFMLFAGQFLNDDMVRKDLKIAARLYPLKDWQIDRLDLHLNLWELYENRWLDPPREYDEYREAIMHVCARGRMGGTWPPALHGSVVAYLGQRPDITGDSKERTFEPMLANRTINPREGALDGYHVKPHARIRTPDGEEVVSTPDQTKREALKGRDRKTRKLIKASWDEIQREMHKALGYERRRGPDLASIETRTNWLFRRHLLRESSDYIAAEHNVVTDFVDERVKFLRKELDLQPMKAVRCAHKRLPLYY